MPDLYDFHIKKLFHISSNNNYGAAKLSTGTDQAFKRFITPANSATGQYGCWYPTLVVARLSSYPSSGTIGGIYMGSSGAGTAIVNSYTWPTGGGTEVVLPIYTTNFPNPFTGGQCALVTGTPNLYMNTPSTGTPGVSIWIFGFETNDVF